MTAYGGLAPETMRFYAEISRYDRAVNSLKAQQIRHPDIADSLQERIDRLSQARQAYLNAVTECGNCGLVRADHVNDKCPFAPSQWVGKDSYGRNEQKLLVIERRPRGDLRSFHGMIRGEE